MEVDRYSRQTFEITTAKEPTRQRVRVATIGEALDEYTASTPNPGAPTRPVCRVISARSALLYRRPVTLRRLRYTSRG
jgi:hypothetical protein